MLIRAGRTHSGTLVIGCRALQGWVTGREREINIHRVGDSTLSSDCIELPW